MEKSRKSIRWKSWDYSSAGAYFITICTKGKECFLGNIRLHHDSGLVGSHHDVTLLGRNHDVTPQETAYLPYPDLHSYLHPTPVGLIAWEYWTQIPQHYEFVLLDAFVIMPNHIHGILVFDKSPNKVWETNRFGPQKDNLPDVIRAFKGSVKRWANYQGEPLTWQRRYHDRVIRNWEEFELIQQYIWNNPYRWRMGEALP